MRYIVPLEKKYYLRELSQQLEGLFGGWSEGFTGVILGNFIYVTHNAGFEWNRRISNERSHAIGFVAKHKDGCSVNVVFTRGNLDPCSLVFTYLICIVLHLIAGYGELHGDAYWISAVATVVTGLITWFQCWFTERGQAGMYELRLLLQDPRRFWTDCEEE